MTGILTHPSMDIIEDRTNVDEAAEERLEESSRDGLERFERGLAAQAIAAALESDSEPVALRHRGQVIWAQPLNTRRFVQAMAPHICFN